MLFVFPDHLFRIQKDLSSSPEMDAMFHEVDPILFLIPLKGSFRQIYVKILKQKCLLPVPLYINMMRLAIQFVLQIIIPDSCTSIGNYAFRNCKNLKYIRVSVGVDIPSNAFEGCGNVVIDRNAE